MPPKRFDPVSSRKQHQNTKEGPVIIDLDDDDFQPSGKRQGTTAATRQPRKRVSRSQKPNPNDFAPLPAQANSLLPSQTPVFAPKSGQIWKSAHGHPIGSKEWLKEVFDRGPVWKAIIACPVFKKRLFNTLVMGAEHGESCQKQGEAESVKQEAPKRKRAAAKVTRPAQHSSEDDTDDDAPPAKKPALAKVTIGQDDDTSDEDLSSVGRQDVGMFIEEYALGTSNIDKTKKQLSTSRISSRFAGITFDSDVEDESVPEQTPARSNPPRSMQARSSNSKDAENLARAGERQGQQFHVATESLEIDNSAMTSKEDVGTLGDSNEASATGYTREPVSIRATMNGNEQPSGGFDQLPEQTEQQTTVAAEVAVPGDPEGVFGVQTGSFADHDLFRGQPESPVRNYATEYRTEIPTQNGASADDVVVLDSSMIQQPALGENVQSQTEASEPQEQALKNDEGVNPALVELQSDAVAADRLEITVDASGSQRPVESLEGASVDPQRALDHQNFPAVQARVVSLHDHAEKQTLPGFGATADQGKVGSGRRILGRADRGTAARQYRGDKKHNAEFYFKPKPGQESEEVSTMTERVKGNQAALQGSEGVLDRRAGGVEPLKVVKDPSKSSAATEATAYWVLMGTLGQDGNVN